MSIVERVLILLAIFSCSTRSSHAWRSNECPIDSQDNRESFLCLRPCDYEEGPTKTAASAPSLPTANEKAAREDHYFIVFFPPKSASAQASEQALGRMRCPGGFKLVHEAGQCLCERPYTPYELEQQRREKCDQAFETCRLYGARPYDCNHVVDTCPPMLVRDYCLAGKVFKMRHAKVVYEFCHKFLRLPNDGKRHFITEDSSEEVDKLQQQ